MDQATPISDWKLERYVLDELPEAERDQIRTRIETDEVLRARVEEIAHSDAALRAQYPKASVVPEIRARLEDGTSQRSNLRPWILATLPIAAALLLFLMPPDDDTSVLGNRIKGGDPALFLYRKTPAGVEQLADGSIVAQSDLIQIKYRPGTHRYGVILSIDGRNVVTIHLPESGHTAVELEEGSVDTLGFAYELDDAPHGERFYFITSDVSFDATAISERLRRITFDAEETAIDLGRGYAQRIFTLTKDTNNEN